LRSGFLITNLKTDLDMEPSLKDTHVSEKTQLDFLVGGLWLTILPHRLK
jgi:hypothetical protein